jgi:hypothetical protein
MFVSDKYIKNPIFKYLIKKNPVIKFLIKKLDDGFVDSYRFISNSTYTDQWLHNYWPRIKILQSSTHPYC